MDQINRLLVDRHNKRGILVELSYPSYAVDAFEEFKKLIEESNHKNIEMFVFRDIDPAIDMIIKDSNPTKEDKNEPLEEDITFTSVSTERLFFQRLDKIWQTKEMILDSLNKGLTVVVMHYVYDLILKAYSENAFNVRKLQDRVALP